MPALHPGLVKGSARDEGRDAAAGAYRHARVLTHAIREIVDDVERHVGRRRRVLAGEPSPKALRPFASDMTDIPHLS
jgi:uncharacterized protein (DUF1810 family)